MSLATSGLELHVWFLFEPGSQSAVFWVTRFIPAKLVEPVPTPAPRQSLDLMLTVTEEPSDGLTERTISGTVHEESGGWTVGAIPDFDSLLSGDDDDGGLNPEVRHRPKLSAVCYDYPPSLGCPAT